MLYCRLIFMLSIVCVRLTIKVKVGIPESFKVGWYPSKKTGSSHLNLRFSRHKRRSRSRPGATFLTSVTRRISAASKRKPCSTLSILYRRFKFHARRELSWGRFYNLQVGSKPSPEETVCFNTKRQQDPAVMSDPLSLSLYKTGPFVLGTTIL